MLTKDGLLAWASQVKQRLGLQDFSCWLTSQGDIELAGLEVPKGNRKAGVGSSAVRELCDLADSEGLRVLLTPGMKDERHGTTSRSRLIGFYKRFGFVENKGRNKDFTTRQTMIRIPKQAKKSLVEFLEEYFAESLDTAIPYKWVNGVNDSASEARFQVGNNMYRVSFYLSHENGGSFKGMTLGDVDFVMRDDSGSHHSNITGTGDQFKVFGTIIKIIQEFVQRFHVNVLTFSAYDEPSRKKLYHRLAKHFAKGGKVEVKQNQGEDIFFVRL